MRLLYVFPLLLLAACTPSRDGKSTYQTFSNWRTAHNFTDWEQSIEQYRGKLAKEGLDQKAIERAIEAIGAYGEAELYDIVYTGNPAFNTQPNQLLVEAVRNRRTGHALDIAMGQGRNSVYLASKGWRVTGFDVSQTGIDAAQRVAKSQSVEINAVHASDLDFDFGVNRWDLIALIYAIEKRSVHRIRDALKPGGLIVVEAGHKSASNAPFEYDSNELLEIFKGFRIIHYEEPSARSDWDDKLVRLVRLIAEKPL
jgi:2-polyprenyl-3-methyl-5-hydroxy-6-metoxy-1,4-benzoquinol methylase